MRTASHRPWSPRLDRGKRRGDPPARGIRAVDAKAPRRLRYAASCTSCGISGESRLARYIARGRRRRHRLARPAHSRHPAATSTTSSSPRPVSGSSTPRHIKAKSSSAKSDRCGSATTSSTSAEEIGHRLPRASSDRCRPSTPQCVQTNCCRESTSTRRCVFWTQSGVCSISRSRSATSGFCTPAP
jgi:hypothetical protein